MRVSSSCCFINLFFEVKSGGVNNDILKIRTGTNNNTSLLKQHRLLEFLLLIISDALSLQSAAGK